MTAPPKPPVDPVRWQPPPVDPLPDFGPAELTVIPVPGNAPEDVVVDADGNIWTGVDDGRIVRISPDGQTAVVGDTGGRPLGLAIARDRLRALAAPGRVVDGDRDGHVAEIELAREHGFGHPGHADDGRAVALQAVDLSCGLGAVRTAAYTPRCVTSRGMPALCAAARQRPRSAGVYG